MTASLLGDAFAHHLWATERVIDACAELTPEQLATPVPGTYGSIIDTLRHLVGADRWYLSFFRDGTEAIDEHSDIGLGDLRSAMASNGLAWKAVLAGELDADADVVERGEDWEFHTPLGLRLAQVVHHGSDHRSQVCTALTSLSVAVPEIDLWAWGEAMGRTRTLRLPSA